MAATYPPILVLKNVQIVDAMSEETTCFTADLWHDGARVGTARNDGRGGATLVRVLDPDLRRTLETAVLPLLRPYENLDGIPMRGAAFQPPTKAGFESLEWFVDQSVREVMRAGAPPHGGRHE